jgi:hypothetical protein
MAKPLAAGVRGLRGARALLHANKSEIRVVELGDLTVNEATQLLATLAWERGDSYIGSRQGLILFAAPGRQVQEYLRGGEVRYRDLPRSVEQEVDQLRELLREEAVGRSSFLFAGGWTLCVSAVVGYLLGACGATTSELLLIGGSMEAAGGIYLAMARHVRLLAERRVARTLERMTLQRTERDEGRKRGELTSPRGFSDAPAMELTPDEARQNSDGGRSGRGVPPREPDKGATPLDDEPGGDDAPAVG